MLLYYSISINQGSHYSFKQFNYGILSSGVIESDKISSSSIRFQSKGGCVGKC
ncbi:hypothetical protein SAMN06298216_0107 [Spirosomataceae bacterium TFI 002]|nr:hypothetical protein SAMN06298216_0107 [Spirosomataceae bacterium TFI 002]